MAPCGRMAGARRACGCNRGTGPYAGGMPSYRSILTVSTLKAGHDPGDVESAARDAVRRTTVLEAFQVDVVRGEPRVTVRFTGSDDAEARGVHAHLVEAIGSVSQIERVWLAMVVAGRSVPIGERP